MQERYMRFCPKGVNPSRVLHFPLGNSLMSAAQLVVRSYNEYLCRVRVRQIASLEPNIMCYDIAETHDFLFFP